ncbi:MAG: chalcone isomerase family protein [Gallionella sp.]
MKKILLFLAALLLSLNVSAREVADITIAETAQLGDSKLQLNGAGVRVKIIIDVYIAALYLEKQTNKAEEVLADAGNKRVMLRMLYGMKSSRLLNAMKDAIDDNNSAAELVLLDTRLKKFYAVLEAMPGVTPGDVILLDYVPGTGTKVTINGTVRGVVEGADFYRALLKIWLGDKPVQSELKKDLLGVK